MATLKEALSSCVDYLSKEDIVDPKGQAEFLVSDTLEIMSSDIYLYLDRFLSNTEMKRLSEALQRRANGEPLQYIKGEVNFYGCKINVNKDVLIPRQETELLVDMIAYGLSNVDLDGQVLWDICCGSGCIGIALKKRFPKLNVIMSDISSKSLRIARQNAVKNGVKVDCLQGDLLKPFAGLKANYIVCNPPYVSKEEWKFLDTEVRNYEPAQALVAKNGGLEFYERLSKGLCNYLKPFGKVWLEIGATQGPKVQAIFEKIPWVKSCALDQDLSGKDRIFSIEKDV